MTVAEIIEELKKMPQDADVEVLGSNGYGCKYYGGRIHVKVIDICYGKVIICGCEHK